jgi:hypothetical protein
MSAVTQAVEGLTGLGCDVVWQCWWFWMLVAAFLCGCLLAVFFFRRRRDTKAILASQREMEGAVLTMNSMSSTVLHESTLSLGRSSAGHLGMSGKSQLAADFQKREPQDTDEEATLLNTMGPLSLPG